MKIYAIYIIPDHCGHEVILKMISNRSDAELLREKYRKEEPTQFFYLKVYDVIE